MNIWEQSFEDLRRPHLEEKKGDGNLANNYPPYDKVTRGDVIAGATGKDQMGGKKKMVMKKEHSDWRSDLGFFIEEDCGSGPMKPKKDIKNKITINPDLKTEETLSENPLVGLGIKAGLAAGTALAGKMVYDKAKGIADKLNQRNQQTQKAINQLRNSFDPEGEDLSEREMTSGEMQKEKTLKKKYDPSGMKASMKKQYGAEKGKQVYFATIRKKAMEEFGEEQIDEISQRTATNAYASSYTGEFEGQDSPRDVKRTDNLRRQIKRKFGDKAAQHADRAAHAKTFGRNSKFVKMPKKPTNEDFEFWVNELVEEGYDLSDYTWDEMYEFYLDEALRPASERMKSMQTAAGRKKQEQERTKKSKLEAEADKILAGFSKKGTGTSKTKAAPKAAAPEANRSLKTGQKKDTLSMKANKAMKENLVTEREMDEPGERDDRPDVKRHNKMVGYRPKPKRPSIANDPRYGTVQDKSGKWKY